MNNLVRRFKFLLNEYKFLILVKKILKKVGIVSSKTYFLRLPITKFMQHHDFKDIKFTTLTDRDLDSFNLIKRFDFLDVQFLLSNDKSKTYIAKEGENVIGFVVLHYGETHCVHKLCRFNLKFNEGWVGPTYIAPNYRGKGIHKALIVNVINTCFSLKINALYTCINSDNKSSIKSFQSIGFQKVGLVETVGGKIRKITNFNSKFEQKIS